MPGHSSREECRFRLCLGSAIGTSKQQTQETRIPLPERHGQPVHVPLEEWRHVKVTNRRTGRDSAKVLQDLADIHFPDRKTVLYEALEPGQAAELSRRFKVHHTPGHGSWLNMA